MEGQEAREFQQVLDRRWGEDYELDGQHSFQSSHCHFGSSNPNTVHCDCDGNNTGDEGEVGVDRFAELHDFSSGRDVADFVIRRFFLEAIYEVLDGGYVVGRAHFCTLELW